MSEQEKTEQASPKKRLDARREGNSAKSADVVAVAGLLAGVACLAASARSQGAFALDFFRASFSQPFALQTDVATLSGSLSGTILTFLTKFALLAFALVLGGVVANLAQSGFLFLPKKIAPDFARLNPAKGFGRVFSGEAAVQLILGIVKLAVVVAVVAAALWGDRENWVGLPVATLPEIIAHFAQFATRTALKLVGALVLLAVVDYAWRRFRWERELMSTPQEVKDEAKEESGDPQVVARRRELRARLTSPADVPPTPRSASKRNQNR